MGPSGEILSISGKIFRKKSVKKLNYMAVNKKYKTILDNSESKTDITYRLFFMVVIKFLSKEKKRKHSIY